MNLVKHTAADLPRVDSQPPCAACGLTAVGIARNPLTGVFEQLCVPCSRPPKQEIRVNLSTMWRQLAAEYAAAPEALERHVDLALSDHRPDVLPQERWRLFDAVVAAVVARDTAAQDTAVAELIDTPDTPAQTTKDAA